MAKTNFGDIKKQLDKSNQARGSFTAKKYDYMKLVFGDNRLVILPPKDENSEISHEVWLHYTTDADGKTRAIKCALRKFGSCPICDQVNALEQEAAAEGDEGKAKVAKDMRAQKTMVMNVLDEGFKHKVLAAKPLQYKALLAEIYSMNEDEAIDITDVEGGTARMIKLTRIKAMPWVTAKTISKPLNISKEMVTKALSEMADITTIYPDMSPEEIVYQLTTTAEEREANYKAKNKVQEETHDEAQDEEEVPTPVKAKPVLKAATKPVVKVQEEELDDIPDTSELVQPTTPVRVAPPKETTKPTVSEDKVSAIMNKIRGRMK